MLNMCAAFYNDCNVMDWAIPYGAHTGPRNILDGRLTTPGVVHLGNTYEARLLPMLNLFVALSRISISDLSHSFTSTIKEKIVYR